MNMLSRRAIRLLGFLAVALFSACGGGGGGGGGGGSDTTAPSVVTTTPADTETGVAFNAVITVTLSEAIDPTSVAPTSLSVQQGATAIPGSVVVSGSTVTFQPEVALRSGLTYTATLDAGVSNLAGNPVGTSFSWQFTVAAYNVAFVTSVTGNANLSTWPDAAGNVGLSAGDAICQARAAAADLPNPANFVAWLSDENDDAYCRIHGLTGKRSANCGQATLPAAAGPWVRTDGFPFAAPITELLDNGKVFTPVRFDELGVPVAAGSLLTDEHFTGTSRDGSLVLLQDIPATCGNWTSNANSADLRLAVGATEHTTNAWTNVANFLSGVACNRSLHLLCMQIGTGPALPPLVPNGKKAFLTSTFGTGNLSSWADAGGNVGLAAGDTICQARAAAAGLANAGNFKAWLSDSMTDARDRITSDGPWVRLDGVPVAANKADLLDGSLFTSINVDETGAFRSGDIVWSGTTDSGTKSLLTCNDWTDGTSGTGASGSANDAGSGWSDDRTDACNASARWLRCFED